MAGVCRTVAIHAAILGFRLERLIIGSNDRANPRPVFRAEIGKGAGKGVIQPYDALIVRELLLKEAPDDFVSFRSVNFHG